MSECGGAQRGLGKDGGRWKQRGWGSESGQMRHRGTCHTKGPSESVEHGWAGVAPWAGLALAWSGGMSCNDDAVFHEPVVHPQLKQWPTYSTTV